MLAVKMITSMRQRQAELERLRRQQEWEERQRQAQIEQQRRQQQFQQEQARRQQDQLIQEGARIFEQFIRR